MASGYTLDIFGLLISNLDGVSKLLSLLIFDHMWFGGGDFFYPIIKSPQQRLFWVVAIGKTNIEKQNCSIFFLIIIIFACIIFFEVVFL